MTASTVAALVAAASMACSAGTPLPEVAQEMSDSRITLAPGESRRLPDSEAVLTFESVTEDSRCPTGVTCVWEGDAAVHITIGVPGTQAAGYTLHTNERFEREAVHEALHIRLTDLAPHPTADGPVNPDDYRATLVIRGQ